MEHLKLALPIFGRVEELALAHHFFYKGKCCMGSAWSARNTPGNGQTATLRVAVTVTSPVTGKGLLAMAITQTIVLEEMAHHAVPIFLRGKDCIGTAGSIRNRVAHGVFGRNPYPCTNLPPGALVNSK